MDQVGAITLAIFALGVAVGVGRLSARVESLEEWRTELRNDLKAIKSAVDEISGVFHRRGH